MSSDLSGKSQLSDRLHIPFLPTGGYEFCAPNWAGVDALRNMP